MQPWPALLAGAGTALSAWDAVELAAIAVLATTSAVLWRRARRPAPRPQVEGLPMVVVAAAVAAVIDEPHRIVGVVEVPESARPATLWSLEGRRAHFASHQLR